MDNSVDDAHEPTTSLSVDGLTTTTPPPPTTTTTTSPPINLTDLPIEILQLICANFCFHCQRDRGRIVLRKPALEHIEEKDRNTLRSLCLVSRTLREAAQPILFHGLFFDARKWHADSLHAFLGLILGTFARRPELARHVRSVDIDARDKHCDCCRRCDAGPATDKEREMLRLLSRRTGFPLLKGCFGGASIAETMMQQLLLMLPGLTEICMNIPLHWKFYAWLRYRALVDPEVHPERLHPLYAVRRLELELQEELVDACDRNHELCNHPTAESPVERALIQAAPNVRLLCCSGGGLNDRPVLRELKALQLLVAGSWKDMIVPVMQGFPRLAHFHYWSANEHGPTAREIHEALLPLSNSLVTLNANLEKYIFHNHIMNNWEPRPGPYSVIGSMAAMRSLKVLALDASMLDDEGQHNNGSGISLTGLNKSERLGHRLCDVLPDSLEVLHIDDWTETGISAVPLAKAVAQGRFPNLRQAVWFDPSWEDAFTLALSRKRKKKKWIENCQVPFSGRLQDGLWRGHAVAFPDWEPLITDRGSLWKKARSYDIS